MVFGDIVGSLLPILKSVFAPRDAEEHFDQLPVLGTRREPTDVQNVPRAKPNEPPKTHKYGSKPIGPQCSNPCFHLDTRATHSEYKGANSRFVFSSRDV